MACGHEPSDPAEDYGPPARTGQSREPPVSSPQYRLSSASCCERRSDRRECLTTGLPQAEEHVDEAALEAAHRRPAGLALRPLLLVVRLSARLAAPLDQRDDVEGAVELAVATRVDAVPMPATRGHR